MSYDRSKENEQNQAPPQNEDTQENAHTEKGETPRGVTADTKRPDPESVSVGDLFPTTDLGFEPPITGMDKEELPDSAKEVLNTSAKGLDGAVKSAIQESGKFPPENVMIHTGEKATKAAQELDARAFTVDNHIVFNRGEYDLESPEGKSLLAHELTAIKQNREAVSVLPKDASLPEFEQAQEETQAAE